MNTWLNKIPLSGINLKNPSLSVYPLRQMKSIFVISLTVLLFS